MTKTYKMKISIIIINFRTYSLLAKCLESIYAIQSQRILEVWVVDNASNDGSVEKLRIEFPDVKIIANQDNKGFGAANNQAMRHANGDIFLLLNPDTLVIQGLFESILNTFQMHSEVGIVGGHLINEDYSTQPSYGEFSSWWTEFFFQFFLYKLFPAPFPVGTKIHNKQIEDYSISHKVDWVSGACLAVRNDVVEKAGYFDERIFMYGEDMDLCWRVDHLGYESWFCAEGKVIHFPKQKSGRDYSKWISDYTKGNLRFIYTHSPRHLVQFSGFLVILGSLLRIVLVSMAYLIKVNLSSYSEYQQRMSGYLKAIELGWNILFHHDA